MRKILIGSAAVAPVVALSGCGGSSDNSTLEQAITPGRCDMYAISQIERDFHEAIPRRTSTR